MAITVPTTAAGRVLISKQTSATTTHTFPNQTSLTKASGDVFLALIGFAHSGNTGAKFSAWGASFTEIYDVGVDDYGSYGLAWKVSTGSETGTFTVTSSISQKSVMFLIAIPGAHNTTAPELGGQVTNGNAVPNSGSLNPAGWGTEETLWISAAILRRISGSTVDPMLTAAPTNYGTIIEDQVGTATNDIGMGIATRLLSAASEDPGGFTDNVANSHDNLAFTIGVRPSSVSTQNITPTGPTITVTPGIPSLTYDQTISATGPTITVTAGVATVRPDQLVTPVGPTITITPGTATVTPVQAIAPTGPTITITAGTPALQLAVTPTGPTITVTPGTPALRLNITPTGPTITVTAGTPTVANVAAQPISPTGPTVTVTPGVPALQLNITPSGPTITVVPGTASVVGVATDQSINPVGPTITVTPGTATVSATTNLVLDGPTITITPGTPSLTQTISVDGPTITVVPGTPVIASPQALVLDGPTIRVIPGVAKVGIQRRLRRLEPRLDYREDEEILLLLV